MKIQQQMKKITIIKLKLMKTRQVVHASQIFFAGVCYFKQSELLLKDSKSPVQMARAEGTNKMGHPKR